MSRIRIGWPLFFLATLVAAGSLPVAAQVGLTVSHEADAVARLYRVNLESGSYGEAANLGAALSFAALDWGPDGLIYALAWDDRLHTLDPATGATELIGELTTVDPRGLAFGPGGSLWVVGGQILERIDPATATTLDSLTLAEPLLALAATGDQLFGISAGNRRLWAIDTATGVLTLIAGLPGIFLSGFDADFDPDGTLWILGIGPGPIMGTSATGIYSVPDPASGEVIEHHNWLFNLGEDDPRAYFGGLVLARRGAAIDVPALSRPGLALLIALLALLGASSARRFAGGL